MPVLLYADFSCKQNNLHTWEVEHTSSLLGNFHSTQVFMSGNVGIFIFGYFAFWFPIWPISQFLLVQKGSISSTIPIALTSHIPCNPPYSLHYQCGFYFFILKMEEAHSSETSVSTHMSKPRMLKSYHFLFPPCMLHAHFLHSLFVTILRILNIFIV